MASKRRNPAPLAGGNRVSGLLISADNGPEVTPSAIILQVARLSRRFILTPSHAATVARLVYGETQQ